MCAGIGEVVPFSNLHENIIHSRMALPWPHVWSFQLVTFAILSGIVNQRDMDDYLVLFQLMRWEGRELNWLTWASLSVCRNQKLNPLRIINPVFFPPPPPVPATGTSPSPYSSHGNCQRRSLWLRGAARTGILALQRVAWWQCALPRSTAPGWCGYLHGKSSLNVWPGQPQILSQPFLATLSSFFTGWGRERPREWWGAGPGWVCKTLMNVICAFSLTQLGQLHWSEIPHSIVLLLRKQNWLHSALGLVHVDRFRRICKPDAFTIYCLF